MKVDLIKNDKLVIIPFWILIFFILASGFAASKVDMGVDPVFCSSCAHDMSHCKLFEWLASAQGDETKRSKIVYVPVFFFLFAHRICFSCIY